MVNFSCLSWNSKVLYHCQRPWNFVYIWRKYTNDLKVSLKTVLRYKRMDRLCDAKVYTVLAWYSYLRQHLKSSEMWIGEQKMKRHAKEGLIRNESSRSEILLILYSSFTCPAKHTFLCKSPSLAKMFLCYNLQNHITVSSVEIKNYLRFFVEQFISFI